MPMYISEINLLDLFLMVDSSSVYTSSLYLMIFRSCCCWSALIVEKIFVIGWGPLLL